MKLITGHNLRTGIVVYRTAAKGWISEADLYRAIVDKKPYSVRGLLMKDLMGTVAQVAKRLGVSRATFYAYFPGARSRSLA